MLVVQSQRPLELRSWSSDPAELGRPGRSARLRNEDGYLLLVDWMDGGQHGLCGVAAMKITRQVMGFPLRSCASMLDVETVETVKKCNVPEQPEHSDHPQTPRRLRPIPASIATSMEGGSRHTDEFCCHSCGQPRTILKITISVGDIWCYKPSDHPLVVVCGRVNPAVAIGPWACWVCPARSGKVRWGALTFSHNSRSGVADSASHHSPPLCCQLFFWDQYDQLPGHWILHYTVQSGAAPFIIGL